MAKRRSPICDRTDLVLSCRQAGWAAALMLLASAAKAAGPAPPVPAPPAPSTPGLHIFAPPPWQWDAAMFSVRPALQQTPTDLGRLDGGIVFGMTPQAVQAQLPDHGSLGWDDLRAAPEYQAEVRYFWKPLAGLPALRAGVTACIGASSYVAFLFNPQGLFRLSFRLLPDAACPVTTEAALQLFGRTITIGEPVALNVHYRTQSAEVVDITDPAAGFLIATRWRMTGN